MAAFGEKDQVVYDFSEWVRKNGGSYPKIDWPVDDPSCGSRGALAREDIKSGEPMLSIPISLMMSPPNAYKDPVIGAILEENEDNLRDDLLLAVFIMYEVSKGAKSFWYPYIRMMPKPESSMKWDDEELRELQDIRIMTRIRSRIRSLKSVFDRRLRPFFSCYPEVFPDHVFHYEAFQFAWFSIQARAFGRRLPWTAMVPFADCLNHTNVQTKYDYDVDSNGTFRLFPSGLNCYMKGQEVFNSYGRRPNDNLLIDYGFSLMNNQWDHIDLPLDIRRDDELFLEKSAILHELRLPSIHSYRVSRVGFPLSLMQYARLAVLDRREFESLIINDGRPMSQKFTGVVSPANEMRALQRLQRGMVLFLADHRSTVVDDEALLEAKGTGFDREACALTYRITRKRIALDVMEKIAAIQKVLLAPIDVDVAAVAMQALLEMLLRGVPANDIEDGLKEGLEIYVEQLETKRVSSRLS
jgi:hypothetical protein